MQGSNEIQILNHVQFPEQHSQCKKYPQRSGSMCKVRDEIELVCEGEDEEEALKTLVDAIEGGLGE